MTVALVTGATGQDGSYLCEQLVAEGVEVHAALGPDVELSDGGRSELEAAHPWLRGTHLHTVDLRDGAGLAALVARTAPDEVYNLAGMSSVARSWEEPVLTAEVNALAVGVLLQACWELQERRGAPVRVVQASSSEMFGSAAAPQDEQTPVVPTNPYGAAKAYAHHLVGVYRSRGLLASSCILFNHESPRRPATFVTRKITQGAALVARGELDRLALGNLDARRDWGWAPDYVDGVVRAARHDGGGDYVLATGVSRTVRDFVAAAFDAVGITDWAPRVYSDPRFTRPVDAEESRGDATRARTELGWRITVDLPEIVARMVAADL